MKKNLKMVLPVAAMLLSLTSCNNLSKYDFVGKEVKVYMIDITKEPDKTTLYFSEEYPQIPFIDIKNEGVSFLTKYHDGENREKNDPYKITATESGISNITLKRENGAEITFNADWNTVYSKSLNNFKRSTYSNSPLDLSSFDPSWYDENGNRIKNQMRFNKAQSLKFEEDGTTNYQGGNYYYTGDEINMNLNDYNINIIKRHGKYLIPFTTFVNIAGSSYIPIAFNGQDVFVGGLDTNKKDGKGKSLQDVFYDAKKGVKRSKALIDYTYNEFCRDYDYLYGLKDTHGLYNLNHFLTENDWKKYFYNEDQYTVGVGLLRLMWGRIGDLHTSFVYNGPYETGKESPGMFDAMGEPTFPVNDSVKDFLSNQSSITPERVKRNIVERVGTGLTNTHTKVKKPYQVSGDTAILTFDSFILKEDVNYYYSDDFKNNKANHLYMTDGTDAVDTVALISYANDQIKNNPDIKNVVIDLSANGGGALDAALFVLGWVDSAELILEDPNTHEMGETRYFSDINFDKTYSTDGDSLFYNKDGTARNINLYCMTSPLSFSCGNFVPAMIEQTNKGKIIGTKSGGGACAVRTSCLGDGSWFNFSSNYRLCQEKNGSFYHIDKGITPYASLKDFDIMYGPEPQKGVTDPDRSNLTSFIDAIK